MKCYQRGALLPPPKQRSGGCWGRLRAVLTEAVLTQGSSSLTPADKHRALCQASRSHPSWLHARSQTHLYQLLFSLGSASSWETPVFSHHHRSQNSMTWATLLLLHTPQGAPTAAWFLYMQGGTLPVSYICKRGFSSLSQPAVSQFSWARRMLVSHAVPTGDANRIPFLSVWMLVVCSIWPAGTLSQCLVLQACRDPVSCQHTVEGLFKILWESRQHVSKVLFHICMHQTKRKQELFM